MASLGRTSPNRLLATATRVLARRFAAAERVAKSRAS